ncbi:hypothetical protein ACN47E_008611 [Coniothyrium glycines]
MKIACLLAFSASTYALAFDGPEPTPALDIAALDGFTPKPTPKPRAVPELFRRQTSENAAICGYLEGDAEFPVSCTAGDCFHATSLNWFGCCTGTGDASCNVATRCIASASVASCLSDAACSDDRYLTACTDPAAPSCANLFSTRGGQVVSHLVCVATATSVEVLPNVIGSSIVASSALESSIDAAKAESTSASVRDTSSTSRTTARTSANPSGGIDAAATPSRSIAGAAVQTANALAAGGLVGVLALLF